ncbi:hypothetical protein F4819DRAFT_247816 [Hypoxylon fuscum]|nr:hypothetical protein F4819DRAFT_247816 [Hypoxylon fuscum]
MSYMSRHNSSASLMGFSVHQPVIGAPLQFFPAMGSKQLDEMIDAYVPGKASILDKRAAVSVEFYQHIVETGELFKFFMVYPSLGSTTESPTNSMLDSGYASSNFTSPVMSESQWTISGGVSFSSSDTKTQKSSSKKAATSTDFSHLPGMKIMTRDGQDVTNSASRGCKTKEQRDHAHLMRIIKACEACRKKKIRCDPSHRRSAGSSGAKATKKAKKTAASSASSSASQQQPALEPLEQFLDPSSFDFSNMGASSSFDSVMPESLVDPTMDWEQFVQYNEDTTAAIPFDYDFFFDPAGHFSPTSSNSASSQPITPAQSFGTENLGTNAGTAKGEAQAPLPPYLNPGGETGNNYTDFNLYSPGSSTYLDDDPTLTKEISAMPRTGYIEDLSHQQLRDGHRWEDHACQDQTLDATQPEFTNAEHQRPLFSQEQASSPAALDSSLYYAGLSHRPIQSPDLTNGNRGQNDQVPVWHVPIAPGRLDPQPPTETNEPWPQPYPSSSPAGPNVLPISPSASSPRSPMSQHRLSPATARSQLSQQHSVATMARSHSSIISTGLVTLGTTTRTPESSLVDYAASAQTETSRVSISHTLNQSSMLRHLQQPRISDVKQVTSHTTVPKSDVIDSNSSSISSTSQQRETMKMGIGRSHGSTSSAIHVPITSPRQQTMKTVSNTRHRSTSGARLDARDTLRHSAPTGTSCMSFQNIAGASAPRKDGLLNGITHSAPLSGTSEGVLSAVGVLFSALAACLLALVFFRDAVLSTLCHWRLGFKTEELGTVPTLAEYWSTAITYTTSQDTKCAVMLDLPAQPLSFLARFSISIIDNMKSRYSQLSRDISKIQCESKQKFASNGARALTTGLSRISRSSLI